MKESIEILRPRLSNGDLGDGVLVDGLEPLKIDDIVINRGEGFYVNLNNLKALGVKNFKIDKLRINVVDFKVDVLVDVPKIEAFGKYKLKMLLGILQLNSEGNMKGVLGEKVVAARCGTSQSSFSSSDNVKFKISLGGTKYMKNGREYVRIDKTDVFVKIPKMKLHFENLFPNDKVLSDLGNNLVNQNIDMFLKDIEPALQKSLGE